MSYCQNCGEPFEEGARFCRKCGSELASQQPKKKINKTDERVKDYLQSKYFKFWTTFFFILFCVFPACGVCAITGMVPAMFTFFENLLGS